MTSRIESIHTPEQQDAAYEQYMSDYQASLEQCGAACNTHVAEAVDEAQQAKASEGSMAFPNASDTISVALNATGQVATECVATGIDNFYAVATPEDTETLDAAAGHFYKYEFGKAYALIDDNASSDTGRRAMRTAMDRFTLDMVDDTLTESHDRIANADKKRVLEIYDFIRDYASSDAAQEVMFTLVDKHVNHAITTEPLYSDEEPVRVGVNKQFIEDVASNEVSRQALRGSFDAIVFKKIDAKLSRHRYAEAEDYVRQASDEASRTQLHESIVAQKKTYVAAKIAERRLSKTQPKEAVAEHETQPIIEVGRAEKARHGEDTILQNDENRLYGVFDGMGSNAGTASEAAAKALDAYFDHFKNDEFASLEEGEDRMRSAFTYAREAVRRYGHGGTTTAVLAHIADVAGTKYVFTANAGDSRMIFRDQKGNMFDMTPDQSVAGNSILNGFGPDIDGWPQVADDFNAFEVVPGDQVLICSDGITGDTEAQALTPEEFDDAFSQPNAQASAERFLQLSKKNDDKSVLVLKI